MFTILRENKEKKKAYHSLILKKSLTNKNKSPLPFFAKRQCILTNKVRS